MGELMVSRSEGETLVLIVEDEPDNREIMRAVVEDLLGYKALLAADGEEALRLANDHRPHLILMDLMMPVLGGFETIHKLKTGHDTVAIPIVAVTALSRPVDRQRAVENGADDYLSKPFDLDLLAEIVERHISRRSKSPHGERDVQSDQAWGEPAGY
jgi:CheY-like chemotaxis protein